MNSLLVVTGFLVGWLLLWRLPTLRRMPSRPGLMPGPLPRYAVVIPARDEAHNLAPLLAQVSAQTVPPVEIVVVDDQSSDSTVEVATAGGAEVVHAGPLPPGWVGKTWACHQGAAATSAPVLVFLDADVRLETGALPSVLAAMPERPGLVSVAPRHRVEQPYEWLSLVFALVAVMGVGCATPRARRVRGAFGPCIAIRREDYCRIGGHESVRGAVVEDIALAEVATSHGLVVKVLGGGREMSYRMYPLGFRSMLEGWTKNIATGAGKADRIRSLGVFTWVAGGLIVSAGILSLEPLAFAAFAVWVLQVARMSRQVGDFPPLAWIGFPLLLIWFVFVFARSFVMTALKREVRWRGRDIRVRSGHAVAGPT